jgi:hypothetical protein
MNDAEWFAEHAAYMATPEWAFRRGERPGERPDMTDEVPDDFAREFEALYLDETILPFHTTAFRAWCMMAAIQLASRHPEAMKGPTLKVAVEMARHIQSVIATTPALARVAEQGWDQTLDE